MKFSLAAIMLTLTTRKFRLPVNTEERPNPDELLQAVQHQEQGSTRGCLKIFLGMAAGVGKTYAMLEEARKLSQDGTNVVVGTVRTHGRQETEALLAGLPVIPEKEIIYKDATFSELDLDAILQAKPTIVLVDELAHSNLPGSRHRKRWQDVVEILENGIDVYTTLNVQHIESLKDFIESIAGIPIRETVPDSIIESATFIELIDIIPGELRQRLKEGKVYLGDQSEIAARHFFQEDRLTALREVTLRYAAEKVDHDLHGMMSTIERSKRWTPRERLLVAIEHTSNSQKLIRTTRRLAFNLNAPWIALHVNDGTIYDDEGQNMLIKNLTLARDLGAEVITKTEANIPLAIEKIARQKGVTQIIIGRKPKSFFSSFSFKKSVLEQLTANCEDIDIHVIRMAHQESVSNKAPSTTSLYDLVYPYAMISVWAFLFTIINLTYIAPLIGYKIAGFFFLLCILCMSLFFKKGPIFFVSLFYAFIWWEVFVPSASDHIEDTMTEDQMLLLLYVLTAIVMGILTDRSRKDQELLLQRERSTEALYEIVKEIATSPSSKQLLFSIRRKLGLLLEGQCEIIVKEQDGDLNYEAAPKIAQNVQEKASATWVYQNGKEAGWSTETLSGSNYFFVPLKGFNEFVGVLAYQPIAKKKLSFEDQNFLYTVGHQLASYLERTLSEERHLKLQDKNKTEKIYQSILSALSEQLQPPLQAIQNTFVELNKDHALLSPATQNLLNMMKSSFKVLTQSIEGLSAMANLSAGLIPINKAPHQIKELIDSCLEMEKKITEKHIIRVEIEENLPLVQFDFSLLQILLSQLMANASKNSPQGSQIEIRAKREDNALHLSVSDEGKGIPAEMLNSVFEKFYKVPGSSSPGLGLGLSIAYTIATVHGGSLSAKNNPHAGACFLLLLPIELDKSKAME